MDHEHLAALLPNLGVQEAAAELGEHAIAGGNEGGHVQGGGGNQLQQPAAPAPSLLASIGKGLLSCILAPWHLMFGGAFPLSDQALTAFLIDVADKSVSGLLTLSCFGATYFLAWRKPSTVCLAKLDSSPTMVQILFVSLPFVLYPISVFTSGMAKVARHNQLALGGVAVLTLLEIILVIIMAGAMAVCMSGVSPFFVTVVTVVLIIEVIFGWGCLFKHPKKLRKFIWSTICRQAVDEDQQ